MSYCKNRSLGMIICVAAMVLAAGCDSNSSAPDSGACDPACPKGQECVDGACKDTVKTCDPACTNDQECVDGACKDKVKSCDPACPDGQECDNGECKDKVKSCDPACPEGQECDNGECKEAGCSDVGCDPDPVEPECNPECTDKQSCSGGKCIDIDEPGVASFNVTPLDGLVTVQNLVNTSFTVSLDSAPQNDVILPLEMSNPKAGTLSAENVTFTHDNWDKAQTVMVTGAKEVMPEDETSYQIVVGPSKSEDANYNGLDAVNIQVKHYNRFNTLKLDKTEASLLLRKVKKTSEHDVNSVTFTAMVPESSTDKEVKWEVKNLTDKVDEKKLVKTSVEKDDKAGTSTITITRIDIDLKSEETRKNHLDWARTLQVSASTKDSQSIDAKLELKPYLPLGFNFGYYKSNVKDFAYAANKTDDISCEYYDLHTVQVLNEDMYRYYVEPNMVKNDKGELVPTRASVVAAARFLVLQFPKDIPYSGTSKCVTNDGKKCTVGKPTFASYIWSDSSYKKKENYDYKDYQLFGLSLSPNGYNSLTEFDSPIKTDLESWGCSYKEFINEQLGGDTIYGVQGRVVKHPDVGMCCSAFVSWSIRNGMFDLGRVVTSVFAKQANNNTERMYTDKELLYKNDSINEHVNTYEKLKGLKESDFIPLSAVDKANSVGMKAGDLLYYSSICDCEKGKKCPDECTCNSGGHLAMILGIYYKKVDGKKEIAGIYVAEAQSAGNRMTHWTIDGTSNKFAYWNCTDNKCNVNDEKKTCREVKLIKMGNVYNYYSPKGDTENYTDMWW